MRARAVEDEEAEAVVVRSTSFHRTCQRESLKRARKPVRCKKWVARKAKGVQRQSHAMRGLRSFLAGASAPQIRTHLEQSSSRTLCDVQTAAADWGFHQSAAAVCTPHRSHTLLRGRDRQGPPTPDVEQPVPPGAPMKSSSEMRSNLHQG